MPAARRRGRPGPAAFTAPGRTRRRGKGVCRRRPAPGGPRSRGGQSGGHWDTAQGRTGGGRGPGSHGTGVPGQAGPPPPAPPAPGRPRPRCHGDRQTPPLPRRERRGSMVLLAR